MDDRVNTDIQNTLSYTKQTIYSGPLYYTPDEYCNNLIYNIGNFLILAVKKHHWSIVVVHQVIIIKIYSYKTQSTTFHNRTVEGGFIVWFHYYI